MDFTKAAFDDEIPEDFKKRVQATRLAKTIADASEASREVRQRVVQLSRE